MINLEKKLNRKSVSQPAPFKRTCPLHHTSTPFFNFSDSPPPLPPSSGGGNQNLLPPPLKREGGGVRTIISNLLYITVLFQLPVTTPENQKFFHVEMKWVKGKIRSDFS